MKPPTPYFGGKQRIASQIVDLFPEHLHYVEPYAGSLSILLAKSPSKIETVNDLDQQLVTFWRILRDRPNDLQRACDLTPHSRAELADARDLSGDIDDLELARRIWVQLTQGRSALRKSSGWRFYLDASATNRGMSGYLDGYRARLHPAAERMIGVSLECRDALDVIRDYGQHESTLLYVDPPYLPETRTNGKYLHEADHRHHEELASALSRCIAHVALSGYASDMYLDLYAGWHRTSIAATSQTTPGRSGEAARTEVVWTNFEPHPHLFSEKAS